MASKHSADTWMAPGDSAALGRGTGGREQRREGALTSSYILSLILYMCVGLVDKL